MYIAPNTRHVQLGLIIGMKRLQKGNPHHRNIKQCNARRPFLFFSPNVCVANNLQIRYNVAPQLKSKRAIDQV